MTLSLIEIIEACAGKATVFSLFGHAMYWLGVSRTKLNSLTADVKELKKSTITRFDAWRHVLGIFGVNPILDFGRICL
jgi:hypothetical protein